MQSVYTTTITDEARRRGIDVEVLDAELPVFRLSFRGKSVRCFNALTDHVGAATFHLAQDKHAANTFLAENGFPVPAQIKYTDPAQAKAFLEQHGSVVVKPCREWGGRGVSVAVKDKAALTPAITRALAFGDDLVLEQCVNGEDKRVIIVDNRFAAAILRRPATVRGNGKDSIRTLIRKKNTRQTRLDPSNRVPLDAETRRTLKSLGLTLNTVLLPGRTVRVRRTTNFHTGGTCIDISDRVDKSLVAEAKRVTKLYNVPVMGVDFLANSRTGRCWIIEVSADLAISPPEGHRVVRRFMDYLFPETQARERRHRPPMNKTTARKRPS